MAGERIEHFHSSGPSPEPLRIKVERGQKGGYAFEVSLAGADETAMIARIKGIYAALDAEFSSKVVA
jgi:lysylphosphatidylglycerol synthetase-like protein (DUF2156 family)